MLVSRLRPNFLLILVSLLLVSCRPAATPTLAPTDPPPNLNLEGIWSGLTDQNQAVVFVMSGGKLTQFTLDYNVETCTSKVFNMTVNPPGIGKFSGHTLTVELPQKVEISFFSDTSAQGSFEFDTSQGLLASVCQPGLKQPITFKATKIERGTPSPQP